jgi:two-component system, cell cycle response regulator
MPVNPSHPGQPRLLAIDDSLLIHRLLKTRLKNERIEIHCATSATQGLNLAKTLLPEVILLDIDMPEMSGFDVLRLLKADPLTHDIPVIFVSGSYETESKVRGFDMGAIDFVTKPFDVNELKARVRSAVRIRMLIKLLAQRAQIDGLTGLWNRSYFDDRLHGEISNAQRHSMSLALILCDLDNFKRLNDTYGHPFGDHVLEEFARLLNTGRAGDIACRYGGEEFVIVLPQTTAEDAATIADRYRSAIKSIHWPGRPDLVVTCSFGVSDLERSGTATALAILDSADQALYSAKQSGRDRVVLAEPLKTPMKLSA